MKKLFNSCSNAPISPRNIGANKQQFKVFQEISNTIQQSNTKMIKSQQQVNQVPIDSTKACSKHITVLATKFCVQCMEKQCDACCLNHSKASDQHQIIHVSALLDLIKEQITQFNANIQQILDESIELSLPDYTNDKEEGISVIEKAENAVIQKIQEYFDTLKYKYQQMFCNIPCKDQFEYTIQKFNQIQEEIQNFEEIFTPNSNSSVLQYSSNNDEENIERKETFQNLMVDEHTNKKYLNNNNITNASQLKMNSFNNNTNNRIKQEATVQENEENNLNFDEIKKFFQNDYSTQLRVINENFQKLKDYESTNLKVCLPQVSINTQELKKIENSLIDYITAQVSTQNVYSQIKQIRINRSNYFLPEFSSYLPSIDASNNILNLYDIQHNKKEQLMMVTLLGQNKIPEEASILITPNIDIYISGGIETHNNNHISDNFFLCSILNQQNYDQNLLNRSVYHEQQQIKVNILENSQMNLQQQLGDFQKQPQQQCPQVQLEIKSRMKTQKVGHSLCFICNKIYSFGGRVSESQRTNRCEKYNIETNQWIELQPMKFERTRPGLCSFNDKFIYVFYGSQSSDCCNIIEKYDIEKDEWQVIEVSNNIFNFGLTFSSAIQINDNQILVFGGFFNDKNSNNCNEDQQKNIQEFKKTNIIFNRRAGLLNIKENSFINLGEIIPFNYCQNYSPLIYNKNIYCLGFPIKTLQPEITRLVENDFVLAFENGHATCKNILNYA